MPNIVESSKRQKVKYEHRNGAATTIAADSYTGKYLAYKYKKCLSEKPDRRRRHYWRNARYKLKQRGLLNEKASLTQKGKNVAKLLYPLTKKGQKDKIYDDLADSINLPDDWAIKIICSTDTLFSYKIDDEEKSIVIYFPKAAFPDGYYENRSKIVKRLVRETGWKVYEQSLQRFIIMAKATVEGESGWTKVDDILAVSAYQALERYKRIPSDHIVKTHITIKGQKIPVWVVVSEDGEDWHHMTSKEFKMVS